jgi:hypothetical protein
LVFRSYVGNEEKTALEAPESNATKPESKGISISPLVPTPQYSEDKKNVAPPLTPAPTPASPVVPAPAPPGAPPTPEPLAVPLGPPQPRLRSVIPLEQGPTGEIVFPDKIGGLEGTIALPLPPPLPKANEANSTGDSNKTERRGLLPGLFRRK